MQPCMSTERIPDPAGTEVLLGVSAVSQQRDRRRKRNIVCRMRCPLLAGHGKRVNVPADNSHKLHVAPHGVAARRRRKRDRNRAVFLVVRVLRSQSQPETYKGYESRAERRWPRRRCHCLRVRHPRAGTTVHSVVLPQSDRSPHRLLHHVRFSTHGESDY